MPDIKEAADRLQRLKDGESVESVYPEELFGMESSRFEFERRKDHATLADAYLAEHDPTPIDEAWYRATIPASVYAPDDSPLSVFVNDDGDVLLHIEFDDHPEESCDVLMPHIKTRGQLLRLLAALKEPT